MDCKVAVTKFLGGYAVLGGTGFGGGAVFVGTAYIQGFITPQPAKAGKGVGGQHLNQVSQMGDVIYVRQCGSDKSAFHILHGIRKRGGWGGGIGVGYHVNDGCRRPVGKQG